MKQDFIDWLAADEKGREISDDVGLLVVPVENEQPPESVPDVQEPTPQEANENNFFVENLSDLSSEILELNETVKQLQTSLADPPAVNQINDTEIKIDLDDDTDIHKAWQETAADLNLSLDEPPPELWTRINEYDEDYDDDEIEYEQGMSLQGAAYVQKREHGKNFTERLHYTLKGRKQKAEALRKEEEERKKTRHPYFSRAVIFCTTMLMVIGVAFAALWFVSEWLPEKLRVKHEEPTPVVSEELESGRSEE
ncbi:MAG: hypothetical protein IJU31_01805 [Synergistaceae bacterium]|nr:hypothetical protein [Synergistaceae bacterium]